MLNQRGDKKYLYTTQIRLVLLERPCLSSHAQHLSRIEVRMVHKCSISSFLTTLLMIHCRSGTQSCGLTKRLGF